MEAPWNCASSLCLHGGTCTEYCLGDSLVRLRVGLEWGNMRYNRGCVRFVAVQEWRHLLGHGGRL